MSADTLTLTDFLLARIAEDESRLCDGPLSGWGFPDAAIAKPMAEYKAKREVIRLLALQTEATPDQSVEYRCLWWLARPYADHPDYREGWKS